MNIAIPELALVVLAGASGSGKSTFAHAHFKETEILSSDRCRALVADDENDQSATSDAFDLLHYIAAKRLAAGRLCVVDATNVQSEARRPLVALARQFHCIPVAIVLDMPESLCRERNANRPDRNFGQHVIHRHVQQLRRSMRDLKREGFRHVFVLDSPEEIAETSVTREPLWNNLRHEKGPFDIVGDVHGCYNELRALLQQLGYAFGSDGTAPLHPEGRKAVFLGDLVDRGPQIPDVLRLVMAMVRAGSALCVPGNHDIKLMRKLSGRDVQITHGLADSLEQLEHEEPVFRAETAEFINSLVSHYVLDDGKLVVAHAGMKQELQGRGSGKVRDFALYGETTGETDEFGLPVRYNWAAEYRGTAVVVYGHTPVPEPEWLNRTINLDTGCVFGGSLTALRYPEKELASVPAMQAYAEPARPFLDEASAAATGNDGREAGDVLDISDVLGKRIISTRLQKNITIREENASAALEVMSRFAADPHWLIYLPPTMSPPETSSLPDFLEHPAEAYAYYQRNGISHVLCEEKHMGSRTVLLICRDANAAHKRFGVTDGASGICYTRTGRRFFADRDVEEHLLARIRECVSAAGLWEELETDWLCLDCELMPWSAKALELLKVQYAAVGAASGPARHAAVAALEQAQVRGIRLEENGASLLERMRASELSAAGFKEAYRRYCWEVGTIGDLRLAPFHLLAAEGQVFADREHVWHMEILSRIADKDPVVIATPHRLVDLHDAQSQAEGCSWWEELTARGGEGMVVKPPQFVTRGSKGLVQPAVKCRGREYLRLIYGPDYLAQENLERLKTRGLAAKRALALREFALGIEALERFVHHEPLYRVHECVFGVLAMESEPVDPRL